MANAVDDFQSHLQAQGIVDGATGWPTYKRGLPGEPDQGVALTEAGGPAPTTRTNEESPSVQVRVRGKKGESDAAKAKLAEIEDALHDKSDFPIDGTRYIWIRAESEKLFLEFDEHGRPEFAQTFETLT